MGIGKTYASIATDYYWSRMFIDISDYMRRCPDCQMGKVVQLDTSGLMGP